MADGFDLGGRLRVDFSELEEIPDRMEAAVAAADGQTIGITTEVDDSQATRSFKQIGATINHLDKTVARPKIEVDGSQADRVIADLREQFKALDLRIAKLKADAAGLPGGAPPRGAADDQAEPQDRGKTVDFMGGLSRKITTAALAAYTTKKLYGATVSPLIQNAKVEGAVTRNFGAQTGQEFIAASEALSEATGFLANDFREAALAGRTLAAMSDRPAEAARLQVAATKKLLPLAADIARTSPDKQLQSVAGAFNAMKSAIAGSASAQERLGVDLSDAHMQTRAFGGALRGTWADLSAAEQAQLRYKDMLAQTADLVGSAEDENTLEFQTKALNTSLNNLATDIGTAVEGPLKDFLAWINDLVNAIPDWVPKAVGFVAEGQEGGGWPVRPIWRAMNAVRDLAGPRLVQPPTTVISGAKAHNLNGLWPPGYSSPAPVPAAVPTTVKVSLNVRREPGTTINLDSASYAPSNT